MAFDLSYSLRRRYIDDFFERQVASIAPGSVVLDLGGKRKNKRGKFDIEKFGLDVTYVNTDATTEPDVVADAAQTPLADGSFDAVVCAELLEHVPDPATILRECKRVLRDGGVLLLTCPFLVPIHADPHDYARYTDTYWLRTLDEAGFSVTEVERQGGYWSVLADMLRARAYADLSSGLHNSRWTRRAARLAIGWVIERATRWDCEAQGPVGGFVARYTTGFGVVANKPS